MPKTIVGIELYTVAELTKLLNVTSQTLRNYIKSGKLRGQKLAGRWHISSGNLRDFLEAKAKRLPLNE